MLSTVLYMYVPYVVWWLENLEGGAYMCETNKEICLFEPPWQAAAKEGNERRKEEGRI